MTPLLNTGQIWERKRDKMIVFELIKFFCKGHALTSTFCSEIW